jgi:hypothetical protein
MLISLVECRCNRSYTVYWWQKEFYSPQRAPTLSLHLLGDATCVRIRCIRKALAYMPSALAGHRPQGKAGSPNPVHLSLRSASSQAHNSGPYSGPNIQGIAIHACGMRFRFWSRSTFRQGLSEQDRRSFVIGVTPWSTPRAPYPM